MQTSYLMADIKEKVNNLKWEADDQFKKDLKAEFRKQCESNPEVQYDIKLFGDSVKILHDLIRKYSTSRSYRIGMHYSKSSLYEELEYLYIQSKDKEYNKLHDQFRIIQNKLKTIRNPDKALEFLHLCGIELPTNAKPSQPDAPVDVDFIKSVLPKNVLLTDGGGNGEPV